MAVERQVSHCASGSITSDGAIATNGPFVMNTQAALRQAFEDYRLGRF